MNSSDKDDIALSSSVSSGVKILHIATVDLTPYCFLRPFLRFLVKKGLDVTVATTLTQFRKELEETGVKVVDIPMPRWIHPIGDMIAIYKLYKLIKKEKFHAVHSRTTKAGFISRIACNLAGVPIIMHSILEPAHNSVNNPLFKKLLILLERFLSSVTHQVFTTSTANREEILRTKIVAEEKLVRVTEGIETEKYLAVTCDPQEVRKRLGISSDDFFICTVARLEKAKGHIYLIQSAKKIIKEIPNARFVCVGKGPLKEMLEEKAREKGVDKNFIFTGFRADMLEILKSCDLFVLPSLYEGLGVVLLEALMFKKPVVCCQVGGVVDVIIPDETGILVPPRNSEKLAEAILNLIKEPEKMKNLGEKGFKHVIENFDEEDKSEANYQVYKKIFQQKLGIDLP